jgi:hypothetical protein
MPKAPLRRGFAASCSHPTVTALSGEAPDADAVVADGQLTITFDPSTDACPTAAVAPTAAFME